LILSLDIGSSSVRAGLYTGKGVRVRGSFVKIEHSLDISADGGAEVEPDEVFRLIVDAIDQVLKRSAKRKGEIEYVASSFFWQSLLGIDKSGKPTTKVLTWADTRSRQSTDILRTKFDEQAVHDRTGARFHSSYWTSKLLWLRKVSPDVFSRTDKWISLSDYVEMKLSDELSTSVSMASGTGIFDIRKCQWDKELAKFLKIDPSALPAVVVQDSDTFSLNSKFRKRFARLANSKWFHAIGDGAADNIGARCVTRSRAALMVATSGAMRVAYEGEPPERIPDGLWCYRIDRKRVIIGGAISNGGNLYAWLAKNLRLPKNAEGLLAERKAGAHGLTVLPFLSGERSTGYDESAKGAILGLTSANDALDILHAALESVALRFAKIYSQLRSVAKIDEIIASGGALRDSPIWTKIIADAIGHELEMNDAHESSSLGAVLLALETTGKIESIARF